MAKLKKLSSKGYVPTLNTKIKRFLYQLPFTTKKLHKEYRPKLIERMEKMVNFDYSKYPRLNMGCGEQRFHCYINIDDVMLKTNCYILPFDNIPLDDSSVKEIYFNAVSLTYCKSDPGKFIAEFSRILIPGGRIVIDNLDQVAKSKRANIKGFFSILKSNGYIRSPYQNKRSIHRLSFIQPTAKVIREMEVNKHTGENIEGKMLELLGQKVLESQINDIINESANPILLKYSSISGEKMEVEGWCVREKGPYDLIIAHTLLDNVQDVKPLLEILDADHLADNGKILFVVRNESSSEDIVYYDKGRIAEIMDDAGYEMKMLQLLDDKESEKGIDEYQFIEYLGCLVNSKKAPVIHQEMGSEYAGKKIFVIGEFGMFGYALLGYHEDGILRGLDQMGMNVRFADFRRTNNYGSIVKQIKDFEPDYVLLALKECLPMMKHIYDDIKHIDAKVLYWFCDAEYHAPFDVGKEIDVMFLSNQGQVEDYKKLYNLERVHYMPQGFDQLSLFDRKLKRIYDVGFAGTVDLSSLHQRRTRLINGLKDKCNVEIVNMIRNNIGRFYSQSKMVFGISDFEEELYVSNRFYIVLGCGAVNLTYRFPGMERLVNEGEHVVSFKEDEELFSKVDHYLKHDNELEQIRINGKKLADEKHTYLKRLDNMLRIVDGKSEGFEGFL